MNPLWSLVVMVAGVTDSPPFMMPPSLPRVVPLLHLRKGLTGPFRVAQSWGQGGGGHSGWPGHSLPLFIWVFAAVSPVLSLSLSPCALPLRPILNQFSQTRKGFIIIIAVVVDSIVSSRKHHYTRKCLGLTPSSALRDDS